MSAFLSAHGGVLATAVMVIACYNLIMSAIAGILNNLKVAEPSWLQKAASIGSAIAGWLSANTPSVPAPSAQQQVVNQQNKS